MSNSLQSAANRLKAAEQAEAEARREAEKARTAWLSAAGTERTRLLKELLELADAIGVIQGERTRTGILLSKGGRSLAIDEAPQGDRLRLEYATAQRGEHVKLDTDTKWWWVREGRSLAFLEHGLEEILVSALGLPHPEGVEGVPPRRPQAPGQGPAGGEPAQPGRSGTRSHKPSRDLPPGSVVKDLKGPGPS